MFDKGLFGGMFDFNNDGKMDSFEKTVEFSLLETIVFVYWWYNTAKGFGN